jgi:hypothetical protein
MLGSARNAVPGLRLTVGDLCGAIGVPFATMALPRKVDAAEEGADSESRAGLAVRGVCEGLSPYACLVHSDVAEELFVTWPRMSRRGVPTRGGSVGHRQSVAIALSWSP